MSYDAELAERVRHALADEDGVSEKRMFGGLAFLIHGHLAVAASHSGGLLLRCAPEQTAELLDPPRVDHFVMRGRPMRGWLRVEATAVADDDDLHHWVRHGVAAASAQPA